MMNARFVLRNERDEDLRKRENCSRSSRRLPFTVNTFALHEENIAQHRFGPSCFPVLQSFPQPVGRKSEMRSIPMRQPGLQRTIPHKSAFEKGKKYICVAVLLGSQT